MNSLYSLRFFAAALVYLHHLYYPYGFGAICVTFFFVMSGFTMAYSLDKREFAINKNSLLKFYLNKIIKIYPLYVLTFFASIPIMNFLKAKFNLFNVVINLSMLQSYYPNKSEVFLFNGLSWFAADIVFFYLVTPFIYVLIKKIQNNRKILFLLLLFIFLFAFFVSYQFSWKVEAYSIGWWFIYISPFFRIVDYLVGFICGIIFINIKLKTKKLSFIYSLFEILAILFLIISYKSKFLLIDSLRYGVFYLPSLALLIFIFAFGRGIISKAISNKLFVYLGKLSFVTYMVHQIIIYYTSMYLGNTMFYSENMSLNNYLAQVFLFFIILCIGDVINRYFVPFINNNITKGKKYEYKN